jgi:hypothetical protein
MSYDVELVDPITKSRITFDFKHKIRGGTYQMGGCSEAWLNVTYNYSPHFYRVLDSEKGLRALYGKTGAESISAIEQAIAQLGDDVDADYWKPTEGNAKRALFGLLAFARLRPDGVWDGD